MKQEFTKEDTKVVKGMAVLSLLFYHLFENYDLVEKMKVNISPFSMDSFLMMSGFGNICVAVFAFLSAYGITRGLLNQETAGYRDACRRYVKLTLNFLAMYISVNLLWFRKFDYAKLYGKGWQSLIYLILDSLGLSAVFKTPMMNETWWYMEWAVLIIFLVPLLFSAVKKMGNYSIIIALLLPSVVDLTFDFKRYYFVVLLGVLAAGGKWFEKMFSWNIPRALQIFSGIVILIICVVVRQNYVVYHEFGYLIDAPVALFLCWFGANVLAVIPGIHQILSFLGKHSMNIYFVHTFFYMAIYQKFIYSFRYAGLIFLMLVLVSVLYSVVLEIIKKGLGFYKIFRRIDAK